MDQTACLRALIDRECETSTVTPTFKKRRRSSQSENEINSDTVSAGTTRSRNRRSVTHEIRQLRAQVAAMESELQRLQYKWKTQLPSLWTRRAAQHSARTKYEVAQTEDVRSGLEELFLHQQLMFASLQATILHGPLSSNWEEIVEGLHFETKLGENEIERKKELFAHYKRSLKTIPSHVDRIAQAAIDKVLARRSKDDLTKPVTPLSQIDVTGLKDSSLISSVFVSEIPNTTLEEVYEAILVSFFGNIPALLKRHFGIHATRKKLDCMDASMQYWRLSIDGKVIPSTANNVLCAQLTPTHGIIHVDAIVSDPLHPLPYTNLVKYKICGLTVTPQKESETGKPSGVTLKWIALYQYNLLPDDPVLLMDLRVIRPILNGDLITSSVCEYLRNKQQSSS
ncbi:uncharacterized protein PHALS_14146 [Plasmopara halstedii]|uniref:Uncharacterized protein n=1 Tax=Plasmopara halstedii TaxID=4781 RepID=A0A0P1ASM9_PLAHL|nr:uncharacterized protein PHALS_14146 [Plasmopara halstedii]CEG43857.1 hypothetical protein PHALS_14146 [Plasmopara halstedii]|eukprot:XP_024580226.1 hypothetical protein PHALS_14146 [Plasmopara halstedii]